MEKKIRVLIAKPGLDGHDRGAIMVAYGLRDQGLEVIYTGIRQTPVKIANTALQEDVDVVGLSCHSSAHNVLFPEVVELLRKEGGEDIIVIGGGIIPEEDYDYLKSHGIAGVFGPGTSFTEISDFVRAEVERKSSTRTAGTGGTP